MADVRFDEALDAARDAWLTAIEAFCLSQERVRGRHIFDALCSWRSSTPFQTPKWENSTPEAIKEKAYLIFGRAMACKFGLKGE